MTTLSGKTALVTGASRGIGRASALKLAQAGAQVLVHFGSGPRKPSGRRGDSQGRRPRAEQRSTFFFFLLVQRIAVFRQTGH